MNDLMLMEKAGAILSGTFEYLKKIVAIDVSTNEIDLAIGSFVKDNHATPACLGYMGFPKNSCISVNNEVAHGIASEYSLKEGDIVSIDIIVQYEECYVDAARTFIIGNADQTAIDLVIKTKECFLNGLQYAKSGYMVKDITKAIHEHADKTNYSIVRELAGHGVGHEIQCRPFIPNHLSEIEGNDEQLKSGMYVAIEPILNEGTHFIELKENGWTSITCDGKRSAHYEDTIAILDNGYINLTNQE